MGYRRPWRWWTPALLLALSATWAVNAQEDATPNLTPPELGSFELESITDVVVEDVPIIPELTDHARIIYERGQEAGRNAQVFSKIGDCMTASAEFLNPFGTGDYDLGEFAELQAVVHYFDAVPARTEEAEVDFSAFDNPGLSTASGFTTTSVLDSTWSDPQWCNANESPLECEYRWSQPAFALVMFGTNDVLFFDTATFDYYYRMIILETIEADIVPVLYTIPVRPEQPDRTDEFNRVVIRIAEDYDLPLVNLFAAVNDLPDNGVDPVEPIHLSFPEDDQTGNLTEDYLQYGYNMRNLVTLQTFAQFLTDLEIDLSAFEEA